MTDRPVMGLGSWTVRRRFLFAVVGFCMGVVSYILWKDMTSTVAETAITMAFLCITSAVGGYVFGATWEDVQTRKILGPAATASKKTSATTTAEVTTSTADTEGGA